MIRAMRNPRRRVLNPNQLSLPFQGRGRNAISFVTMGDDASAVQGMAVKSKHKNTFNEGHEYQIGASMICKGPSPISFDVKVDSVLDILAPHIGHSAALLLELLGYRTLRDLARSGYHLAAIPSIGPKRTEKILTVIEGYGFSPPRGPAPVPRHWRALFDQAGQ